MRSLACLKIARCLIRVHLCCCFHLCYFGQIHAHEDSLGSLDTIMLREMEARKSTDGGVLGLSPGSNDSFTLRHGRSIRTSMDARNVVEDALSQLDGVLKETRMMQVNERSNWRDSVEPGEESSYSFCLLVQLMCSSCGCGE